MKNKTRSEALACLKQRSKAEWQLEGL